jgi:4-amino-4-deoxy-L-arabinose transferase-like glycosyltransferase
MLPRSLETALARATLVMLAVYIPAETWASASESLLSPYYIVDAIAMGLLLYGALHSLRARPRRAPGILCGAYGWTAANGWRATFDRWAHLVDGGELDYGRPELFVVGCATALAIGCFGLSLYLVAVPAEQESQASVRV